MKHRDQWEYRPRSAAKKALDFVTAPLRLLLNESWIERFGLTTLTEQRIEAVLPYIEGEYLDIGCGFNRFTKAYGAGWGTDISFFPGVDFLSTADELPVKGALFDTVTLVANLNHIEKKREALAEASRVLKPGGKIILTMLTPGIGRATHFLIKWWDWDKAERETHSKDEGGLSNSEMRRLLAGASFEGIVHTRFMYGLNHLWIAHKGTGGKKPD